MDAYARGVDFANGQMSERNWSDVQGEYVLILDDDDLLADPELIANLKYLCIAHDYPELFMVKMDHGPFGVLPAETWLGAPQRGRQGCSSVIACRPLFLKAVKSYKPAYDGDYDYVKACYESAKDIIWHDTVATQVQQVGALTRV